ncbi:MAG: hypothetical protein LCH99_15485 [Proteobacteria bacterium]|nr:hypothetical protein [Pseudomonadota bacterium]
MNLSDNRTAPGEDGFTSSRPTPEAGDQDDKAFVDLFKRALNASSTYQGAKLTPAWGRNYRAYANRHFTGSKYDTPRYRNRSKLFKPKTRMAVRKNDATAAGALFSTEDVVSVTPERGSSKLQASTAAFLHAILNYRLDRSTRKAGPNWFLTAIGARQDSQMTGICVSKQYWEFEELRRIDTVEVTREGPLLDEAGLPVIDPESGEPIIESVTTEEEEERVELIKDRPMVDLLPPERAFIDMTSDWRDPIQEGGYFIAAFPTRLNDLEHMVQSQSDRPSIGGTRLRNVDVTKLSQGRSAGVNQTTSVRQAREDGVDRLDNRHAGQDNDVIWLYECFYRIDGEDWHWWMCGESMMLSDPVPTKEAYPANRGARPYVRGLGSLESHKTHPMAPVESWQPMQMEINDITNLNLDAMKMAISPITKIVKGRGVDLKAVQNRGPDASVFVEDPADVTFDRAPSPDGSAMANMHVISNDFDELAGVFSGGSVQSNRTLNETVGGMELLASAANSLTEFDLRVWVETWVEPVLHQLVDLIKYYETDETAIAVAGETVGLLGNIKVEEDEEPETGPNGEPMPPKEPDEPPVTLREVLQSLEDTEVTVRVNVGMGALDSRQKLQKLMAATNMTKEMVPLLAEQGIEPNGMEIVQEIWGLNGYRDADRFFRKKKKTEQGPPPEVMIEQMKQKGRMEEIQAEGEKDFRLKAMDLQADQMDTQAEMSIKQGQLTLDQEQFAHQRRMDNMEMAIQQTMQSNQRIEQVLAHLVSAMNPTRSTAF